MVVVEVAFVIGASRVGLGTWHRPVWLVGDVRPASMQTSSKRTWVVGVRVAGLTGVNRVGVSCVEPQSAEIVGPQEFVDVAAHHRLSFSITTPLHEVGPTVRVWAERREDNGLSTFVLKLTP